MRRFSKSCPSEVVTVRVDLDWAFTAAPSLREDLTVLHSDSAEMYDHLLVAYFKYCVGGARVVAALEGCLRSLYGCSWGVMPLSGDGTYQSLRITGASIKRNEVALELANGGVEKLRAACALVSRLPTALSGLGKEGASLGLQEREEDDGPRGDGVTPEWLDAHADVIAMIEDIRHQQQVSKGGAAVGEVDMDGVRSQLLRVALSLPHKRGPEDMSALALRLAITDIIATGGGRHEIPCRLVVTQCR